MTLKNYLHIREFKLETLRKHTPKSRVLTAQTNPLIVIPTWLFNWRKWDFFCSLDVPHVELVFVRRNLHRSTLRGSNRTRFRLPPGQRYRSSLPAWMTQVLHFVLETSPRQRAKPFIIGFFLGQSSQVQIQEEKLWWTTDWASHSSLYHKGYLQKIICHCWYQGGAMCAHGHVVLRETVSQHAIPYTHAPPADLHGAGAGQAGTGTCHENNLTCL